MKKIAMAALLVSFGLGAAESSALADPSYSIKVDAPSVKRASAGVAKIHIVPGPGFHFNKDYPAKMVLDGVPAGVMVKKLTFTAKDAAALSEAGAEFDVGYTASQAGKKTLTGELKFAVCSASSCDPKKEKLSFTVEVK
ncbi:MAG: hypothetical protein ACHQ17_07365 [Polyangia bacterium]|jgi:hypothetical protein